MAAPSWDNSLWQGFKEDAPIFIDRDESGMLPATAGGSLFGCIDRARVIVQGGRGGDGAVKFQAKVGCNPNQRQPVGGDGGRGGAVYLQVQRQCFDFRHLTPMVSAMDGGNGDTSNRSGGDGLDRVLAVPIGTTVRRADTGEVILDLDTELSTPPIKIRVPPSKVKTYVGGVVLLTAGGAGGHGNQRFATGSFRSTRFSRGGQPGESLLLDFELKSVADVALVGFPSSGKSALMAALSSSRPKVSPFPWSTVAPTIGRVYPALWRTFDPIPFLAPPEARGYGWWEAFGTAASGNLPWAHDVSGCFFEGAYGGGFGSVVGPVPLGEMRRHAAVLLSAVAKDRAAAWRGAGASDTGAGGGGDDAGYEGDESGDNEAEGGEWAASEREAIQDDEVSAAARRGRGVCDEPALSPTSESRLSRRRARSSRPGGVSFYSVHSSGSQLKGGDGDGGGGDGTALRTPRPTASQVTAAAAAVCGMLRTNLVRAAAAGGAAAADAVARYVVEGVSVPPPAGRAAREAVGGGPLTASFLEEDADGVGSRYDDGRVVVARGSGDGGAIARGGGTEGFASALTVRPATSLSSLAAAPLLSGPLPSVQVSDLEGSLFAKGTFVGGGAITPQRVLSAASFIDVGQPEVHERAAILDAMAAAQAEEAAAEQLGARSSSSTARGTETPSSTSSSADFHFARPSTAQLRTVAASLPPVLRAVGVVGVYTPHSSPRERTGLEMHDIVPILGVEEAMAARASAEDEAKVAQLRSSGPVVGAYVGGQGSPLGARGGGSGGAVAGSGAVSSGVGGDDLVSRFAALRASLQTASRTAARSTCTASSQTALEGTGEEAFVSSPSTTSPHAQQSTHSSSTPHASSTLSSAAVAGAAWRSLLRPVTPSYTRDAVSNTAAVYLRQLAEYNIQSPAGGVGGSTSRDADGSVTAAAGRDGGDVGEGVEGSGGAYVHMSGSTSSPSHAELGHDGGAPFFPTISSRDGVPAVSPSHSTASHEMSFDLPLAEDVAFDLYTRPSSPLYDIGAAAAWRRGDDGGDGMGGRYVRGGVSEDYASHDQGGWVKRGFATRALISREYAHTAPPQAAARGLVHMMARRREMGALRSSRVAAVDDVVRLFPLSVADMFEGNRRDTVRTSLDMLLPPFRTVDSADQVPVEVLEALTDENRSSNFWQRTPVELEGARERLAEYLKGRALREGARGGSHADGARASGRSDTASALDEGAEVSDVDTLLPPADVVNRDGVGSRVVGGDGLEGGNRSRWQRGGGAVAAAEARDVFAQWWGAAPARGTLSEAEDAVARVELEMENPRNFSLWDSPGVMPPSDDDFLVPNYTIIDLPAVVEGSHVGRGLGLLHLRHAARAKQILYCVDVNEIRLNVLPQANVVGSEGDRMHTGALLPHEVVAALDREVAAYHSDLVGKVGAVVVTKIDACDPQHLLEVCAAIRKVRPHLPIFPVSATQRVNMRPLVQYLSYTLERRAAVELRSEVSSKQILDAVRDSETALRTLRDGLDPLDVAADTAAEQHRTVGGDPGDGFGSRDVSPLTGVLPLRTVASRFAENRVQQDDAISAFFAERGRTVPRGLEGASPYAADAPPRGGDEAFEEHLRRNSGAARLTPRKSSSGRGDAGGEVPPGVYGGIGSGGAVLPSGGDGGGEGLDATLTGAEPRALPPHRGSEGDGAVVGESDALPFDTDEPFGWRNGVEVLTSDAESGTEMVGGGAEVIDKAPPEVGETLVGSTSPLTSTPASQSSPEETSSSGPSPSESLASALRTAFVGEGAVSHTGSLVRGGGSAVMTGDLSEDGVGERAGRPTPLSAAAADAQGTAGRLRPLPLSHVAGAGVGTTVSTRSAIAELTLNPPGTRGDGAESENAVVIAGEWANGVAQQARGDERGLATPSSSSPSPSPQRQRARSSSSGPGVGTDRTRAGTPLVYRVDTFTDLPIHRSPFYVESDVAQRAEAAATPGGVQRDDWYALYDPSGKYHSGLPRRFGSAERGGAAAAPAGPAPGAVAGLFDPFCMRSEGQMDMMGLKKGHSSSSPPSSMVAVAFGLTGASPWVKPFRADIFIPDRTVDPYMTPLREMSTESRKMWGRSKKVADGVYKKLYGARPGVDRPTTAAFRLLRNEVATRRAGGRPMDLSGDLEVAGRGGLNIAHQQVAQEALAIRRRNARFGAATVGRRASFTTRRGHAQPTIAWSRQGLATLPPKFASSYSNATV